VKHYKIEVVIADPMSYSSTDYLSDQVAAALSDLLVEVVGEVAVYEVTHFD
jgi:hypothetical protein